jgi:hypothetical protein
MEEERSNSRPALETSSESRAAADGPRLRDAALHRRKILVVDDED